LTGLPPLFGKALAVRTGHAQGGCIAFLARLSETPLQSLSSLGPASVRMLGAGRFRGVLGPSGAKIQ
jgi:hypothetical protein